MGEGPERPRLEALVEEHGLAGVVGAPGGPSAGGAGRAHNGRRLFVFPSIRELGAGVVVEAMACGLPYLVVDYGGPGGLIAARAGDASTRRWARGIVVPSSLIDDAVGIKLPLADRAGLAIALGGALERLAEDIQLRACPGDAARCRALEEHA